MRRFVKNPYFPYLVMWLILLYVLDFLARKYGLYYIFHYFDKVLHTIGGISLGLFAYICLDAWKPKASVWTRFFWMVGLALVFGGLWEVGEYLKNNLFGAIPFDSWDTTTDVVCDTLGGLFSFIYLTYF